MLKGFFAHFCIEIHVNGALGNVCKIKVLPKILQVPPQYIYRLKGYFAAGSVEFYTPVKYAKKFFFCYLFPYRFSSSFILYFIAVEQPVCPLHWVLHEPNVTNLWLVKCGFPWQCISKIRLFSALCLFVSQI